LIFFLALEASGGKLLESRKDAMAMPITVLMMCRAYQPARCRLIR